MTDIAASGVAKRIAALLEEMEHHPHPAIDLKLERMEQFLAKIGHPQKHTPPIIHVAGTNGKGSTIAYLHALIAAFGGTSHGYTSPHLVRFNERYVLAGQQISDDMLHDALASLMQHVRDMPITYFEAATALAFMLFSQHDADYALLEVGLGGRLDATNVVTKPAATVITPIALDHQAYLGNTIAAIAAEKAAIMKVGCPCIVAPQTAEAQQVIVAHADRLGVSLYCCGVDWKYTLNGDGSWEYHSPYATYQLPAPALKGRHQYSNAATALATMEQLRGDALPEDQIRQALQQVRWPGRLQEVVQRITHHCIIVDGAHNPHAAEALAQWASEQPLPVYMVLGMRTDKACDAVLSLLLPVADAVYVTKASGDPIAMEPQQLAKIISAKSSHEAVLCETVMDAVAMITAAYQTQPGIILVTGSLYLVGDMLSRLN